MKNELSLKIKSITRSKWPRVPKTSFVWIPYEADGIPGIAALIRMDSVTAPLQKVIWGKNVTLADTGYYWLQFALSNNNWWMTVMLDRAGRILQYYFDITLQNHIDGAVSCFTDLFLDVVALPDGRCVLLDMDELNAALDQGVINETMRCTALIAANHLMNAVPENIQSLNQFSALMFNQLSSLFTP